MRLKKLLIFPPSPGEFQLFHDVFGLVSRGPSPCRRVYTCADV